MAYDEETFHGVIYHAGDDGFGSFGEYIAPYIDCYAKKHNIPDETVSHWPQYYPKMVGDWQSQGQEMLGRLESRLRSKMGSFPDTGRDPDHNPAVYYEIASKRTEYLQCYKDQQVAGAAAEKNAQAEQTAGMFLDQIAYTRKLVDEYTPETKAFLVWARNSSDDWLVRSISPAERNAFYTKWSISGTTAAKLDKELDAIAAAAPAKIQAYTNAEAHRFTLRSPAEEKMMRENMSDIPGLIVHGIGFYQLTWNIEKGDFGIPLRRYKTGAIYGRDPRADHPYCWIWTINIRQDYAGGGTYGPSYAKYMGRDIASCPAK